MSAGSQGSPGKSMHVGPYRLVHRLGEGGMGVVHLALAPDGRAVALKALREQVAADPQARRRLSREVEILRRIRHPLVAEVLDADLAGHRPYLVTRFVPGTTLEDHVAQHGPLATAAVARVGRGLAGALAAIHAAGVVHRDVKPANVMLLDGEPILIDFGIAHIADQTRITVAGLVMGTPGYLSPEVVNGHPVTAATDWWGWGSTLAFAASGRAPFGHGPVEVVLDAVRRGNPDLRGVDPRLVPVLTAALVVDPIWRAPADVLVAGLDGRGPLAPPPVLPDAPTIATPAPQVPAASLAPTIRTPSPPRTVVQPAAAAGHVQPPAPPAARPAAVQPRSQPPAPPPAQPRSQPPAQLPGQLQGQPPAPRPPAGPAPQADPLEPQRSAVAPLLAGLAALSCVAVVAPGLAILLGFLFTAAMRTVDRSIVGLWHRRYRAGHRPSDVAVTVAALPWRFCLAVLASLFAAILPVLVGVSAAFVTGSAVARGDAPVPTSAWALAVASAAGMLTAWWGPGGSTVRRAGWATAQRVDRSPTARLAVLGVFALIALAALLVAQTGAAPDFSPFQPAPTN